MSTLLDVLRSIRRREDGPLSCPNCGGPVRKTRTPLEGWILPEKYYCDKCGFNGPIVVQQDKTDEHEDESELVP